MFNLSASLAATTGGSGVAPSYAFGPVDGVFGSLFGFSTTNLQFIGSVTGLSAGTHTIRVYVAAYIAGSWALGSNIYTTTGWGQCNKSLRNTVVPAKFRSEANVSIKNLSLYRIALLFVSTAFASCMPFVVSKKRVVLQVEVNGKDPIRSCSTQVRLSPLLTDQLPRDCPKTVRFN